MVKKTVKVNSRDKVPAEDDFDDIDDFDFGSDDDEDDAPMEVSSKKHIVPDMMLAAGPEPEMSLFEQVQAKKKEEEQNKKDRVKARRLKRKRVQPGEFVVSEKKAEFKVVTLDKGIRNPLEPTRNFKADLLKERTKDRRVKSVKTMSHRAKWATQRS